VTGSPPAGGEPARHAVERRLAALRAEYETGQVRLADVERQEAFLRERLLMLRGAIQAFDDLQAELGSSGPDDQPEPEPGAPASRPG
jgi:hypothetical protein